MCSQTKHFSGVKIIVDLYMCIIQWVPCSVTMIVQGVLYMCCIFSFVLFIFFFSGERLLCWERFSCEYAFLAILFNDISNTRQLRLTISNPDHFCNGCIFLSRYIALSEETAHSTVYHHLNQTSSCITTAQQSLR